MTFSDWEATSHALQFRKQCVERRVDDSKTATNEFAFQIEENK
jgi:hypothetical protein